MTAAAAAAAKAVQEEGKESYQGQAEGEKDAQAAKQCAGFTQAEAAARKAKDDEDRAGGGNLGRHFHTLAKGGFGEVAMYDCTATRSCSSVVGSEAVIAVVGQVLYDSCLSDYHRSRYEVEKKLAFLRQVGW